MILDSSAIVSILTEELGHEGIVRRASAASVLAVGTPTLVETAMVLSSRLGQDPRRLLNDFLREMDVEVIPFTAEHYEVAVDAFERFGKGRHAAALNFGDCLTYAVARLSGHPLLFTGDDFARTDLVATP
jgi:ribonuclease VapC